MDDQRGEISTLSTLLAPSYGQRLVRGPINSEGWTTYKPKMERDPPNAAYIAACRSEGLHVPEKPQRVQGPIDAEDYPASLQIFYVKCAARHGDWRALRGTRPTPQMQDLFVAARAKYLAWKKHQDEEEEREAALPKFWFEIEPGRFVFASSEEKVHTWIEWMKPIANKFESRERVQIEIDTSRTCAHCRLRRSDVGTTLCGHCVSLGYAR